MRELYVSVKLNNEEVYVEDIPYSANITVRTYTEAAKMRARDISRLMPNARVTVTLEKHMTQSERAALTGYERLRKPWILSRMTYKDGYLIKEVIRHPSIYAGQKIAQGETH